MTKLQKKPTGPKLHARYREKINAELYPEDAARGLTEADVLAIQNQALEAFAPAEPAKGPGGRPRNLPTSEDQKAILEYVRRGGKVSLAFERAGLPKTELYRWFRHAQAGEEVCIDFFRALSMEVAEFEIKMVERVLKGGSGISGALHLLQKVAPERWGDDAVAQLIKAAKGEPGGTATIQNTSVHIYLPDNGRGALTQGAIDITPEPTDAED